MIELELMRSFVSWKFHNNTEGQARAKKKVLLLNDMIDTLYESYFAIKPFTIPVNNRCNFGPGKDENSFLYKQFLESIDPRKITYKAHCNACEKFILSLGLLLLFC